MDKNRKFLTDWSVLFPVLLSLFVALTGVVCIAVASGRSDGAIAGFIFLLTGVAGVAISIAVRCWYLVFAGNHVTVRHLMFLRKEYVLRYDEIAGVKVALDSAGLYSTSVRVTFRMKNGTALCRYVMVGGEHVSRLRQEFLANGIQIED